MATILDRRTVLVAIALLGACGSGTETGETEVSADERPYYDALFASFESGGDASTRLDATQSECMASRWVNTLGVERFEQAGVTAQEVRSDQSEISVLGLDEQVAGQLYDAFADCEVDVVDQVEGELIDGFAEAAPLTDADRSCLRDQLDDDLARELTIAAIRGGSAALTQDPDLIGELVRLGAACPGIVTS